MSKKVIAIRRVAVSVICAFITLCYSYVALAQDNTIFIVINGIAVPFTENSGYPYIDENGRTMVPLGVTMEAAGASVGWDQAKQTVIIITEHARIEVPIGTDYLYIDNIKKQNDTVSVLREGRAYLPIKAVLESADFTVEWDSNTGVVNAYSFIFDENEFVPYSTSSARTLLDELLKGHVVFIDGQYYATPDYVKMLSSVKVIYMGDDLNTAIYPDESSRFGLANIKFEEVFKEWVSETDLATVGVSFASYPVKGFYGGLIGSSLHRMPDLPDDFTEKPFAGVFNEVTVKVDKGEILFYQYDLIDLQVLKEAIFETIGVTQ